MKYIAFEGIDCAGKGTQIALLIEWLALQYYTPVILFEPTYGQYGRMIRKSIIERRTLPVAEQVELFTKDRREHVEWKVKPLLEFVKSHTSFLIIQDRCYLSAPAYQAENEMTMLSLLREQQAIAPTPDIIFLIDVPVVEALERQVKSGMEAGLFERREVLERVRENYLFLARECGERIELVDGCGAPESVSREIIKILTGELT